MTTTKTGLQLLPQYQDVKVQPPDKSKKQNFYLVDGVRHERITHMLGIIDKPALVPWAKKMTLGKVGEILSAPETRDGLMELVWEEAEGGRPKSDDTWHADYRGWVERLITTAKSAANQRRDEAAERGTSIHESIADALSDPPMKLNNLPFEQTGYALTWITDWAINVEAVEMTVWDDSLAVAGTCDGVGRNRQGDRIIWDWKTGSGPWWEMALQLGAYAKMIQRLTGERVVNAYIVKLTSTGYEPHRVILPLEGAWEKFEAAVHLKRASALQWFD